MLGRRLQSLGERTGQSKVRPVSPTVDLPTKASVRLVMYGANEGNSET